MIRPALTDAQQLIEGNKVIPIAMELFSDVKTPIQVLSAIQKGGGEFYILESVDSGESWGRYTFLGYKPSMNVHGLDGKIWLNGNEIKGKTPNEVIQKILDDHKSPHVEYLPPFTGGLVGYFSYEYMKYVEKKLVLKAKNPHNFVDFHFMLFDKVIAFDNFKQKIYLIANVKIGAGGEFEKNYAKAAVELEEMKKLILTGCTETIERGKCAVSNFQPMFTQAQYCEMVEKTKRHIFEGDIFQAVISNRLVGEFSGNELEAYRNLRTTNPSPYMFYVNFGETKIMGASPETLVSLKNGTVCSYPLAGTTKRGKTPDEDARLSKELLENEKELSEHDMLVDLGRNDLGKICKFGTVEVAEYRKIKKFSHVAHIASKVVGQIRDELTARGPLSAISATIPAGTLSGAPKKRACEIIDELEKEKRGVYGGAVGYIDFTGNMDLCIGIRMAAFKGGKVFVQSGAGIVADSIPENEHQECLNKAKGMLCALETKTGAES